MRDISYNPYPAWDIVLDSRGTLDMEIEIETPCIIPLYLRVAERGHPQPKLVEALYQQEEIKMHSAHSDPLPQGPYRKFHYRTVKQKPSTIHDVRPAQVIRWTQDGLEIVNI
jgi:hypothetical protein